MQIKRNTDTGDPLTGNQSLFLRLRLSYPEFHFEALDISMEEDGLSIMYVFHIPGLAVFRPVLRIPWQTDYIDIHRIYDDPWFRFLAFQTGMIELISYWKLTCSPRVIIHPYSLDDEGAQWWKDVYFPGLGEFFYTNGIATGQDDFMQIVSGFGKARPAPPRQALQKVFLVPVGGGKDSAVTLELLCRQVRVVPFLLNPRDAMTDTVRAAGLPMDSCVIFHRSLDPQMLELNKQDFLNGHTPFSALLAFQCLLASHLTSSRYIALSNEASANEATIPGSAVNHQYSKTIYFEKAFRYYVKYHLGLETEYFSYLRPLLEIQIAGLFSTFPAHFKGFRSCNLGSKTNTWCSSCPKCLFAFLMLAPFTPKEILEDIFGENLLDKPDLWNDLTKLAGLSEEKPFECIGTIGEVRAALVMVSRQFTEENLPCLLSRYHTMVGEQLPDPDVRILLHHWNEDHCLPVFLATTLQHTWKNYVSSLTNFPGEGS